MQLTADFLPAFTARNTFLHGGRTVLPLNAQIGNRTKACALAGYDCPKADGLAKKDKLPNKMQKRQIDTMPSIGISYRLPQTTCSHIIGVCKMFSCSSKQHMLFWLLKRA